MRALGIDFGERRVGLAISDEDGRVAVPVGTWVRETDRRLVYRLADLARKEGVEVWVLGEPRNLDGSDSEGTDRIRRFGRKLEKASGLPVLRVEETLTTVAAAERLGDAPHRAGAGDRDGRLDAMAAQILLQEALDRGRLRGAAP